MSVTYPLGFVASGVTAGCKPSGLADLGLLVGEQGTVIAGLFTSNRVVAAPVVVSRARLAQGSPRAVVVNSGQANAATGDSGCAKGVGMIAPNLAPNLAFVTTDAVVDAAGLQQMVVDVLLPRFNAFTVDASTSTNDTVLLFASGAAGGDRVAPGSREWNAVEDAVAQVADDLVRQLIADGEGAGHVLVIDVEGAASDADAQAVARAIADSPLVKTAAFGGDPNPGRIVQAAGAAGVAFDPSALDVRIRDVALARGGVISEAYFQPASALAEQARGRMKDAEIQVAVSIGEGPGRARVFGCDLSYEYVRINGEYTT